MGKKRTGTLLFHSFAPRVKQKNFPLVKSFRLCYIIKQFEYKNILNKKDFKTKITIQKELVKFLRAKTKSKIDEPKFYSLSEAPSIKKLDAEFEKLPKHEQEALIAEVKKEMGENV